jgi:hypothetical protein
MHMRFVSRSETAGGRLMGASSVARVRALVTAAVAMVICFICILELKLLLFRALSFDKTPPDGLPTLGGR